jgi:hypothetical protein
MGPAKKRGLFASWLKGKGASNEAQYDGPSGKGKERQSDSGDRQWDAGELDEEMRRIMNAVIFNGGLDYEYVLTVHCALTPVSAKLYIYDIHPMLRTRPMVVITAAALPNPSTVNYDALLPCVSQRRHRPN